MQEQLKVRMFGGMLATGCALVAVAALAQDVEEAADDTWITVSGTVVSSQDEEFRLDYGDGIITVEMDDFDPYDHDNPLLVNDEVVVTGIVDHDLFERKTIEADSVYVENLGTHFYANPADEEKFVSWYQPGPITVGVAQVTGTVSAVTGREFLVSTGLGKVEVDTAGMAINPMDDKGFLQVDVGDRVKVSGVVTHELFDNHELAATSITKLSD